MNRIKFLFRIVHASWAMYSRLYRLLILWVILTEAVITWHCHYDHHYGWGLSICVGLGLGWVISIPTWFVAQRDLRDPESWKRLEKELDKL